MGRGSLPNVSAQFRFGQHPKYRWYCLLILTISLGVFTSHSDLWKAVLPFIMRYRHTRAGTSFNQTEWILPDSPQHRILLLPHRLARKKSSYSVYYGTCSFAMLSNVERNLCGGPGRGCKVICISIVTVFYASSTRAVAGAICACGRDVPRTHDLGVGPSTPSVLRSVHVFCTKALDPSRI